jgi:hypothetical protein
MQISFQRIEISYPTRVVALPALPPTHFFTVPWRKLTKRLIQRQKQDNIKPFAYLILLYHSCASFRCAPHLRKIRPSMPIEHHCLKLTQAVLIYGRDQWDSITDCDHSTDRNLIAELVH